MMISELGELHKSSPHLLADLAELIILFEYEDYDELSQSDIEQLLQTGVLSLDDISESDLLNNSGISSAEITDKTNIFISDLWQQIKYRSKAFPEIYPFILEGGLLRIKTDLSSKNLVYLFLLVCSRLRSFEASFRQTMAKNFTRFSSVLMTCLLPDYACVKIYDAGSEDRANFFGTKNRDGLVKLAGFIGALPINDNIATESDSGDSEIDLVGVVNFEDDSADGYYVLIGQCASQETNWPTKTFEAHPQKLGSLFQSPCDAFNLFFVPVLYRDSNGKWINARKVSGPVFIDRKRAIGLIICNDKFTELYSKEWFQSFINSTLPKFSTLLAA